MIFREESENDGPEAQIVQNRGSQTTWGDCGPEKNKVARNRGSQTRVGECGPEKAKVARNRGSQSGVGERGSSGFGLLGGLG